MTIVIFSPIPFADLHQRPQKLAELFLARGHFVIYVEPGGFRASWSRGPMHFLRDLVRSLVLHVVAFAPPLIHSIPKHAGIHHAPSSDARPVILTAPLCIQLHKTANRFLHRWTFAVHRIFLRRGVAGFKRRGDRLAAFVEHPMWGEILEEGMFSSVIYDCIDDHQSFAGRNLPERIAAWERRLVSLAHGATVTAHLLGERIAAMRNDIPILRVPNGVDIEWFQRQAELAPPPKELADETRTVIGYIGVIGRWLDYDLLDAVIAEFPDALFVFVGPIGAPEEFGRLRRRANVLWIPPRPYADMPAFVRRFDCCLIPFASGGIARTTNPVKVFEYFALGKPVVSTPLVELREYRDAALLWEADDPRTFAAALQAAVSNDAADAAGQRRELARRNSWNARADAIFAFFQEIDRRAESLGNSEAPSKEGTHVAV